MCNLQQLPQNNLYVKSENWTGRKLLCPKCLMYVNDIFTVENWIVREPLFSVFTPNGVIFNLFTASPIETLLAYAAFAMTSANGQIF